MMTRGILGGETPPTEVRPRSTFRSHCLHSPALSRDDGTKRRGVESAIESNRPRSVRKLLPLGRTDSLRFSSSSLSLSLSLSLSSSPRSYRSIPRRREIREKISPPQEIFPHGKWHAVLREAGPKKGTVPPGARRSTPIAGHVRVTSKARTYFVW